MLGPRARMSSRNMLPFVRPPQRKRCENHPHPNLFVVILLLGCLFGPCVGFRACFDSSIHLSDLFFFAEFLGRCEWVLGRSKVRFPSSLLCGHVCFRTPAVVCWDGEGLRNCCLGYAAEQERPRCEIFPCAARLPGEYGPSPHAL